MVTSRSYSHFLKFSYFYFLKSWFFQLCQKLQSLFKKTQGILGVKLYTFYTWVCNLETMKYLRILIYF
jgi:hypothetical protein